MRILICGGGTGGHIYPGLALARFIQGKNRDAEILFVGASRGLETKVVPEAGFNIELIPVRAFNKRSPRELLKASADLIRSVKLSLAIIKRFNPDITVGTGGYAAGPVVLASRLRHIPVIIHEQNAIPGRTNRWLACWVNRVCVSFEESGKYFKTDRVILTGNPRGSEVLACTREEGINRLGLPGNDMRNILVFGGSQGARKINDVMTGLILKRDFPANSRFLFITGNLYYERVREKLKEQELSGIIIKPYLHDMPSALAVADLVVCRAGATALAEITARGVPAVLVPSPNVAYNHQYYNARLLEKEGAARIIAEEYFTPEMLAEQLKELLDSPGVIKEMAVKSAGMGMPDAAERIFKIMLEELQEK